MLDPLINRTLGRYLIQAEIGRGGMAHVYRALDTVLQRPVALKVLQPSLSADPEFARRFEREAVTAANVRHPAIVTIYDVGEADGLRYIAMEYIAGRTLNEVLQERGRLGLPLTIAILEPVAQALDYAHQQGLVHRDIKPHNIMLDTDGRVLLTDFGIAIGQGEGDERLTRTGVFMGTPEYISPEQAQSQPLTGRSDMYSLAVVAYEMLSGYVPFTGGTAQQIMAHAYQAPPRFTSGDGTQPPELDDIFNRALAKDPAQRFVSAGTLVDALRGVARRYNMAPAPRDAIAELAQPRIGSVGVPTVPMGSTPRGGVASPALVPVARGAGGGGAYQQSANAAGGAAAPVGAVPRGGRAGGGDRMPPGSRLPDRPAEGGGGRWPWAILAIGAIATALAVFGIAQLLGAGNTPDPSSSAVPNVTVVGEPTLPPFVSTPLPTATGTTEAIPTDTPTAVPATATTQPTATRVPPTSTPVPPTATVAPTDTPTPLPPTDTPTPVPPTDTPVPLPTVPPTATPPPPTDTPVPPTDTPPPPTDTPPPPTATTAPAATATATTVAVATPTATQAPVPTPTTPLPSPSVIVGGGGRTVLSLQPNGELIRRNLDTNETTVVRGGLDSNSPLARNSDGTTLYASNGQIFVLNNDRQLTDEGINTQPNWGLDNNTIVFASTREDGNSDIYAMNGNGGSEDRLTTNAANDAYPTLGNGVVVFERQRDDGSYDLFTIPLNGDDDDDAAQPAFPQRVGANDRYPRWSPTGAQLAFTGSGGSEIVIADAQSTIITTIAAPNGVTWGGATWSPDGTKLIAFDAGGSGLYAIDAATQAVQPLADSAGQRWPVWTP